MDLSARLERTRRVLDERGVDALLVGPSADLRWLIGYHALPLERLTMLVVPRDGDPRLVVPQLEEPRAKASGAGDLVDIVTFGEQDDPIAHVVAALGTAGSGRLAIQDRLWAMFLLRLQAALPAATYVQGGEIARDLRVRKEPVEIDALRAAGAAIDAVHEQVAGLLRPGRTEAEIGRDIAELIHETHDEVNFVIVASGPNGASPHHETGDRVLEVGDAIVVDIGGTLDGYCSDMTRNYVLGDVPTAYRELHEVLERAQVAGCEAVAPGVEAQEIDRTCRAIIDEAGLGEYFVHRTGHGIGVEEHEEPYIVEGNDTTLQPGMAFSVEPGIYVSGRFGARIEDCVVVTDTGGERLNRLDRAIVEVPV